MAKDVREVFIDIGTTLVLKIVIDCFINKKYGIRFNHIFRLAIFYIYIKK